jgi:DNA-binding transcriptional ArsR family regulator
MNEREFLRLRRQLDEDYNRKVQALELVWEMACGPEPPPAHDTPDKVGKVAYSAEILAILSKISSVFTVKDVEEAIKRDRPDIKMDRSTISHTLKRAARDDQLAVVETGKGKRPTKYRRVGSDRSGLGGLLAAEGRGGLAALHASNAVRVYERIEAIRALAAASASMSKAAEKESGPDDLVNGVRE